VNGLVLKLAPGERVLINGAVIENGDRRTRLTLLTPNANVLRLRDAIHPDEARTPVRRVAYVAQLAVAGEAEPDTAKAQLQTGLRQLADVFRDGESAATIRTALAHVEEGRFYPALRSIRTLLPIEEALLGGSCPAAPQPAPRPAEARP
jgi:flagellar protein FlbT